VGSTYELDYLFMHLLNQFWMLDQGFIITMECGGEEISPLFSSLTVDCSLSHQSRSSQIVMTQRQPLKGDGDDIVP